VLRHSGQTSSVKTLLSLEYIALQHRIVGRDWIRLRFAGGEVDTDRSAVGTIRDGVEGGPPLRSGIDGSKAGCSMSSIVERAITRTFSPALMHLKEGLSKQLSSPALLSCR